MNLAFILFVIASVFSFISGILVAIGAEKGYRLRGLLVMLLDFVCALWFVGMSLLGYMFAYIMAACLLYALCVSIIQFKKNAHSIQKKGWKLMLVTLGILAAFFVTIFGILPIFVIHIEWIFTFACSITIMVQLYAILKYKILPMHNSPLKIWTIVAMMAGFVAIYISLLYLVSKYLFHIESSVEIVAMNLIMIILVIIIFPIAKEIYVAVSSMLSTQKINLAYVVKRLNKAATQNIKYHDLAALLADHLHFKYIGLLINGRLYNSRQLVVTAEQIAEISMLETSQKKIWQKPEGHTKELFEKLGIEAAAELRDAKGKPFGQILVGKPMGKVAFEKRDLSELELIINLIASVVYSKERLKS